MKVIVLGAGVIGVTTAWWLMKAGHEVQVIERQPGPALETSFANGAIIHLSEVGPWARPGMPTKLLRWLGQEEAPFLLRLYAVPRLWRWGLGFLANCRPERWQANALRNLELAVSSLAALREIRAETGIAYDLRERGLLKIFADQAAQDAAGEELRLLEAHGLVVRMLDARQAVALEPALGSLAGPLAGAAHFPEDETGDCHLFTEGLARIATGRGVGFDYDTTVEGLEIESGRLRAVLTSRGRQAADAVVVALGSFTAPFLKPYGLTVPIYPVKGVSLTLPRTAWPEAPSIGILDTARGMGLVPLGDRLRIAGSAEMTGYDQQPSERRCLAILKRATGVFPMLARCYDPATAKLWAGLRPVTPTGTPIIGPTPIQGLWLNAGHGHLGWTLAAGSGKLLAEIMAGERQGAIGHDRFRLAA